MSKALKVWSKFSVTKKDGSVLNLRTVEVPLDASVMETVLQCYLQYFVVEENTFIAAKVPESEEAMEEITEFVLNSAGEEKPQVIVCCYDNDDDENIEVLGSSIMTLVRKSDPPLELEFKTKEMQKLMEIVDGLAEIYDEVKVFDLDPCFSDRGLLVCPDYRGLGIAQELLKVRRLICKEYGIPINGAWMTSYGTQKAAERDGWETVCELQYEDLEKKFNVTYSRNPPSTKFMIARIPL
ncbi:unnamed protein product [Spodoptera littoralis]|uniref:N-acetyltransferase domain-containing protein n=1 Tax=Spodoptera littoralis TaxID=7109 RepID=A0A9P0N8L9_SPOLI|nr:unnamed protein product [Spodoptera littoralis]CAH1645396.1 unnamed protein product [Spodoptera littoralis]